MIKGGGMKEEKDRDTNQVGEEGEDQRKAPSWAQRSHYIYILSCLTQVWLSRAESKDGWVGEVWGWMDEEGLQSRREEKSGLRVRSVVS